MRSVFTFLLLLSISSPAQDLIVIPDTRAVMYKEQVGKIRFSTRVLSSDQILDRQFVDTYTLTHLSDLFFTAFFPNTLTHLKHQLAPELPADSLFRKGNYQFTVWVDGKEIYKSNLMPGAPLQRQQDTTLVLHRPLIDNKNGQGSWSESFWNRFLNFGGSNALTDGTHQLTMEIRPYVLSDTLHVGKVMARGELSLQVAHHPVIDPQKVQLHRPAPYPGLPVSAGGYDTLRIKQLKGSIDTGLFKKISSIVVLREGKILMEEYFNGANRETLHDTRSVGKSFVSTLTGMAIADKYIRSEDMTLGEVYALQHYAYFTKEKAATTLKDLLTMASGFEGDDGDDASPGNEENMYPTSNWVKFALDLPFNNSYKKQWHYFTAGVVILGDVLQRNIKGGLEAYAKRRLFAPLGIQHFQWEYTPQKLPNTAGGLRLRALDLAKFGQLYKNKGYWEGKPLLPQAWVQKSFTPYLPLPGRPGESYGYLFWQKTFQVRGTDHVVNYCSGNGGNYVFMFRDQPLVVVITATAYGQPYAHPQINRMMTEYLIPALIQ